MLAGFMNPLMYIFDYEELDKGNFIIKNKIPYSDIEIYGMERLQKENRPAEFGHSLTDQLAGQTDAGFAIIGMYEDYHNEIKLSEFTETYVATRSIKL
jgi:hypothetical protein